MEIGNVFSRMISPQKAHENKDWHDIRWKLAVLIYITVGEKESYEPHTNYEGNRGTQRGYSSKPLNIALLNVF